MGGGEIRLCELLEEIVQGKDAFTPIPVTLKLNTAGARTARLPPSEAVAVALVINELLTNAVKHCIPGQGECEIRLTIERERATITLVNPGSLPADLDFDHGRGVGTGLRLVKSLLPQSGAGLSLRNIGDKVRAEFNLAPPSVLIRNQ